jgi:hypothetical protein
VTAEEDLAALAHWLFDRARAGEAERLGAYVDAGTPVDLTDAAGNTLVMLAAYHGHTPTSIRSTTALLPPVRSRA